MEKVCSPPDLDAVLKVSADARRVESESGEKYDLGTKGSTSVACVTQAIARPTKSRLQISMDK